MQLSVFVLLYRAETAIFGHILVRHRVNRLAVFGVSFVQIGIWREFSRLGQVAVLLDRPSVIGLCRHVVRDHLGRAKRRLPLQFLPDMHNVERLLANLIDQLIARGCR